MEFDYKVVEVNFDEGFIKVELDLGADGIDQFNLDIRGFATSNEDTPLQLKNALDQLVASRVMALFPPAPPAPKALLELVNQELKVSI